METSKTLDRLAVMLAKSPLTAKAIAKGLGCSVPTAYKRVRQLMARGCKVSIGAEPKPKVKRTGPRAVAYSVREV